MQFSIRFEEKSQAGPMLHFTAHVTDTYVATEISKFDGAEIPDLSATQPESLHWISNYVRSSVLRGAVPSPEREYRFNFLRRAMIACSEHGLARQATLDYLESEEQSFGKYFLAIHHWEQFLAAAWHALETLRYAAVVGRLYEPGDSSIAQRLHDLYNQTKHTESRITSGQMPPQASLAVWLCNSGLRSSDSQLTFTETGEIVAKLGDWANVAEDSLTSPERDHTMMPSASGPSTATPPSHLLEQLKAALRELRKLRHKSRPDDALAN